MAGAVLVCVVAGDGAGAATGAGTTVTGATGAGGATVTEAFKIAGAGGSWEC